MPWFLSLFAAVLVITAIVQPRLGAGWQWDLGNATGYCVIAGLLYLTLPIAQGRGNVRRHELFGNLVLLLALAHALWFLLIDGAAFTYLLPAAPVFMWAGTGALVALMALMSVAAMPARKRVHPVFARFRVWHRWLAVLALAGALWHAVGSGFYVQTWYQVALLIGLSVWVVAVRWLPLRANLRNTVTLRTAAVTCTLFAIAFVGSKSLL